MRARALPVTLALTLLACAGSGDSRVQAPPSRRAVSRPVVQRLVCGTPRGAVRRVSLEPRCWHVSGSSVLVRGPRPHLSLRGGCVARSGASVRLPIRTAGRWRLTWTYSGGSVTGACRESVVAVVFVSGPGGKLVLSMTPLGKRRADLDVRPRGSDKVVLQFWMRGSRSCGGHVRIADIRLTRASPRPVARRRPTDISDTDRDGVPDGRDRCPALHDHRARVSGRPGCPKVVLAVVTKRRIELRAKIRFPPNKATLPKRSFAMLNQVVEILKHRPRLRVEVRVHLGKEPKNYYGRRPSHRRAKAVRQYLLHKGIAPRRVRARGYGGSMPLTLGRTAAERERNRRVELVLF